jgi:Carboxypeptidase regulatory-like domain/TonB-dependent Receptor Plug Domain
MKRRLWLVLLVLICLPSYAQLQTGNIFGHTVAKDGTAIPGVTVTLTGLGAPQTFITDASGSFRFLNLSPGTYALKTDLSGFATTTRQGISVNIGRNADVTLTMNPAASDSIVVTAEAPLLDVRKAGTGATVTKIELEKVPTGRDPWVILQQTPGVLIDRLNVGGSESGQQSNYTAKGVTGDQATWNVDGVNITDVGALGSSPTYYDFDSFEEMQVTTGGTDVRIQTPGVQLNMVTKRGTNDLKGSARYFRTDGSWQATPKIPNGAQGNLKTDIVKAPTGQIIGGYLGRSNQINNINDEGLEAGGPLMKDKLWLWGAYSKQDIKLFVPERTDQLCLAGQTCTTNFLSPNGIADNTTLKTANAKLNAQLASNNSLALAGSRGDKVKFGRNVGPTRPPETAWDQSGPTTIAKIEDTHIFNPSFYLTGLYSKTKGGFQLIPDAGSRCTSIACEEAGPTTWLDINAVPHRSFLAFKTERPQTQYRADMSSFFNTGSLSHELKYGFGYRKAPVTSFTEYPGQSYTFLGASALAPGVTGGAYLFRPTNFTYDVNSNDVYVGDTMLLGNLTLQAGARYDNQKGSVRSGSTTANPIIPDILPAISWNGSSLGKLDWKTISPRIGLTYALGSDHKTLLRAAANRYVDQMGGSEVYLTAPGQYQYLYYYFTDLNGDGRAQRNEICLTAPSPACSALGLTTPGSQLQGFSGLNPANTTSAQQVVRYDPNIKEPRTDELILGFEREIVSDLSIGANATYRKLNNFVATQIEKHQGAGDYVTRADYHLLMLVSGSDPTTGLSWSNVPVYSLGFQPVWRVVTNLPDYNQTYRGIELTATKRMSNRWMLRGNVSLNDWKQHAGANTFADPTRQRTAFGCANCGSTSDVVQGSGTGSGAKGGIFINSKWQYNLTGVYQIPVIETSFGFNLTGRQGYPELYVHRVLVPYPDEATFKQILVTDQPTSVRNPNLTNLDLRLAKDFRLFHTAGFTISADVFNVLNSNTVLQRNTRLYRRETGCTVTSGAGCRAFNAQAANITEIQSPRVVRVGARFTF